MFGVCINAVRLLYLLIEYHHMANHFPPQTEQIGSSMLFLHFSIHIHHNRPVVGLLF